jgi:hypothetical protein
MSSKNYNTPEIFCLPDDDRDLRFQQNVAKVHALGPRAVCELLLELGADTLQMTAIEATVARYAARLDPAGVHAVGANRFALRPGLRLVRGRHD